MLTNLQHVFLGSIFSSLGQLGGHLDKLLEGAPLPLVYCKGERLSHCYGLKR
jgi:hypothetical protein